jgi:ubiquinone biosynthesis protein
MQQIVKALLGFGARMPKELMLFVKNMVFIDGAIANLAPDLDLFDEVAQISLYFATQHGDRIAADVGIDPRTIELDMDGVRAGLGVDGTTERLTHRDLQARRATMRQRLSETAKRGRGRARKP